MIWCGQRFLAFSMLWFLLPALVPVNAAITGVITDNEHGVMVFGRPPATAMLQKRKGVKGNTVRKFPLVL